MEACDGSRCLSLFLSLQHHDTQGAGRAGGARLTGQPATTTTTTHMLQCKPFSATIHSPPLLSLAGALAGGTILAEGWFLAAARPSVTRGIAGYEGSAWFL